MVPNCLRCQIVLVPKCPVPNCPQCQIVRGAKLSWCQIVLVTQVAPLQPLGRTYKCSIIQSGFFIIHSNRMWYVVKWCACYAMRPRGPFVKRKQATFSAWLVQSVRTLVAWPCAASKVNLVREWEEEEEGEGNDWDFSLDQVERSAEWTGSQRKEEKLLMMAFQNNNDKSEKRDCQWKSSMEASEAMVRGLQSWLTFFKWEEVYKPIIPFFLEEYNVHRRDAHTTSADQTKHNQAKLKPNQTKLNHCQNTAQQKANRESYISGNLQKW